jgi:hypothetical protein
MFKVISMSEVIVEVKVIVQIKVTLKVIRTFIVKQVHSQMSTLFESLIPNYSIAQPEIATSDIIFLNRLPWQKTTIPRWLKSNDRLMRYHVFCKSYMHTIIDLDLAEI